MECHLRNRGAACDEFYEASLQADTTIPGVHASYATHLLSMGKVEEANVQFALELQYHPEAAQSCALAQGNFRFAASLPTDSTSPAVPATPVPAPLLQGATP